MWQRSRALVILVWITAVPAVVAAQDFVSPDLVAPATGDDELMRRLEAAEQRIVDLESELSSPPEPGLSRTEVEKAIADYLDEQDEKKAASRPTVRFFGRTHLETLFFPHDTPGIGFFENPTTGADPEDRIQFRRIRIGGQGTILQTGIYRVELDFGNPSAPTFRDTYVGFNDLPYLQTLLIGNQKRPLGLDAWNSNTYVIFMERPTPVNAFNPNFRRIGIETYGHSDNQSINWQMGVFELSDIQTTGRYFGDSLQLSYNARVSGTPWYDEASGGRGYLHLGVSNMYADTDANAGPPDSNVTEARFRVRPELRTTSRWLDTGTIVGANGYDSLGFEGVLNVGSLQFTTEYLQTWVDRVADPSLYFDGGYVQVAYFLTGEHEPWDRETGRLARVQPFENFFLVNTVRGGVGGGWGAWQVAARGSYLNLSDEDIRGGRERNAALALNWYWTPYSKMLFNVVYGQIDNHKPVGGYTSGNFTGMGMRFMFDY